MNKHTLKESIIERRNHYQGRMAENMVNIIYFGKKKDKLEVEQAKLKEGVALKDAKKSAENAELLQQKNIEIAQTDVGIDRGNENIEEDKLLVQSFDELLKTLK